MRGPRRQATCWLSIIGALLWSSCATESVWDPTDQSAMGQGLADVEGAEEGTSPVYLPESRLLVRMTAPQYRLAVGDLFGETIIPPVRLEPDLDVQGLASVGAAESTLSPKGAEHYVNGAKSMAAQMTDEGFRGTLYAPCEPEAASDVTCWESLVHHWGLRLWRRPLSEHEVVEVASVAQDAAGALESVDRGAEWMMVVLLNAPHFLYRIEQGVPVAGGERALSDYERVTRLSFFLWNSVPDAALLTRLGEGLLEDEGAWEALVDEMIDDPRTRRGLRNFMTEWLHLGDLSRLLKDPNVFRAYSPDLGASAMEETLRLAEALVIDERADFRTILTTRKTFVDRRLAAIYEITAPSEEGMAEVTLPADEVRRGLLGHVSFLAARAHVAKSSPTLRGIFVREVLLCQEMAPPPAEVDTSIPEPSQDAVTLRERLEVHMEDPACVGCHSFVDPIGFGFERFDGIGRFRMLDNGGLIDPSGMIDGEPHEGFNGMIVTLANHPAFVDCLVEKLLAYATNRRAGQGEGAWRVALVDGFKSDGHDLLGLMRRIALSPGFVAMAPPEASEVSP